MARLLQLAPGTVFAGEFHVVRAIAEGGMGSVYEVEQVSTGAARALKIMHPQLAADERLRARFVQEAKVGALIESDHVVSVLGAGVEAETETPWLLMELLKGETLSDLLDRRGSLSLSELREVMGQLCHALAGAHQMGIVHRDLKPDNIFLAVPRREGIPFTVKVLDFGIAKLVADAATHQTAAIGTPLWMAPEQTEVGQIIKPATDIWSLGLLAFYSLTGMHYWRIANEESISAAALLREVVLEPLVSATMRAHQLGTPGRIPPGFDGWFGRCVNRDQEARFRDAKVAREALEQVLSVSISSSAPISGAPVSIVSRSGPISLDGRNKHPSGGDPASLRGQSDSMVTGVTIVAAGSVPPGMRSAKELAETTSAPTVPAAPVLNVPVLISNTMHGVGDLEAAGVPTSRSKVWILMASVVLVAGGVVAGVVMKGRDPTVAPVASSSASTSTSTSASASKASGPMFALNSGKTCPAGMASLPGGVFFLESKSKQVSVNPFCIDTNEVTAQDFAACVKKGTCTDAGSQGAGCNLGTKGYEKHPMNCVDWEQARVYCTSVDKRLVTADEWLWTARNADGATLAPWGEAAETDERSCTSTTIKRVSTCETGNHPSGKNLYGVEDLAGNVSEWTAAGDDMGDSVRATLGDNWASTKSFFQAGTKAAAQLEARTVRKREIGFRCAR